MRHAILLTALGMCLFVSGCASWLPPEARARAMCEKFVSDKLKAPATAKFLPDGYTFGGNNNTTWHITGWVDAQNEFGAMIRSKFDCQMTSSDGNLFTATSVTVGNG